MTAIHQSQEAALIARWKQGDRGAGEVLLRQYTEPLLLFFRNKAADTALDLVQRTLLACVQSIANYRGEGSFRSFLFAIAYRTLCSYYASKRGPTESVDFSSISVRDLAASPSQQIAEREEQRILLEALRRLPVESQVMLELYYWESMTVDEIAAVIAVPGGTAKSKLRRARELLRLEIEHLAHSPALLHSTLADLDGWARALREKLQLSA